MQRIRWCRAGSCDVERGCQPRTRRRVVAHREDQQQLGLATAQALKQRVVTIGQPWQVPWVLIRSDAYRYVALGTKPYNVGVADAGQSVLRGQLLDAVATPGCAGSLMSLQRLDSAKQLRAPCRSPLATCNGRGSSRSRRSRCWKRSQVKRGRCPRLRSAARNPALEAAKRWLCGGTLTPP